MRKLARHSCAVRLMAHSMAVLFALVSIFGSFSHAYHGPLHDTIQESVAHQGGHDASSTASLLDHVPAPGENTHKDTHPCCSDLQCHGGIAIVSVDVATVLPRVSTETFSVADQTHEDGNFSGLDRPPRVSVQA